MPDSSSAVIQDVVQGFPPQTLQASENPLHRDKLALCRRVSLATLGANFISRPVNVWITLDQIADA